MEDVEYSKLNDEDLKKEARKLTKAYKAYRDAGGKDIKLGMKFTNNLSKIWVEIKKREKIK